MHKYNDFDLSIKNISKIEGHASLDIKAENGKIKSKLKISESKRFFTQAIQGLSYDKVPGTMSRICGTCSSAHVLCSIEAIERALDIKASEQTFLLRNLLINASHLRDHAMHLYFFCLPDLFNKDSVLDFNEKQHKWVHDALDVKTVGNLLTTLIGGRAVHPPFAVIGGFLQTPGKKEIENAISELEKNRNKILRLIELFYNENKVLCSCPLFPKKCDSISCLLQEERLDRKTNYISLINENFNFLKGKLKTAYSTIIPEENFGKHLERVVLPYSTATAFEFESKEYFVGALARFNLNKENINKKTKKDAKEYLDVFPSTCIFNNELAQAIEMLHEIDSSIEMLEILKNNLKKEKLIKTNLKQNEKEKQGVGVIEAPRGTLYYNIVLNKGVVKQANLCIPTQQNIIHMENSISKYAEQLLEHGKTKKEISLCVEKLIRAYDPCMSCATHFLRINWE